MTICVRMSDGRKLGLLAHKLSGLCVFSGWVHWLNVGGTATSTTRDESTIIAIKWRERERERGRKNVFTWKTITTPKAFKSLKYKQSFWSNKILHEYDKIASRLGDDDGKPNGWILERKKKLQLVKVNMQTNAKWKKRGGERR